MRDKTVLSWGRSCLLSACILWVWSSSHYLASAEEDYDFDDGHVKYDRSLFESEEDKFDPCGLFDRQPSKFKTGEELSKCAKEEMLTPRYGNAYGTPEDFKKHRRTNQRAVFKSWIQSAWAMGRDDIAEEAFQYSRQVLRLHWATNWPSPEWTPTSFFPDIYMPTNGTYNCDTVFSPPDEFSLTDKLRASFENITAHWGVAKDLMSWEDVWPRVKTEGKAWKYLWILRNGKYEQETCQLALGEDACADIIAPFVKGKRSRKLVRGFRTEELKEMMPDEEILIMRMDGPYTRVPFHSGKSNALVNLHLTLSTQPESAKLLVGNETFALENGSMVCFNDGIKHAAEFETDETGAARDVLVFRKAFGPGSHMHAEYDGKRTRGLGKENLDDRRWDTGVFAKAEL